LLREKHQKELIDIENANVETKKMITKL